MPSLTIDHLPQETDTGCLAACGQMVLKHYGVRASQRSLRRLFDTTIGGASFTKLAKLSRYKMHVEIIEGDEQTIHDAIVQDIPLVLFVRTSQFSHWSEDSQHAVVAVGIDKAYIWINDPFFQSAPISVPIDEMMLAWLEMDFQCAIIQPIS